MMTRADDPSDRGGAADRSGGATRRCLLTALGGGGVALLAGCTGADEGPTYEEGEVNETDGEPRSAEEMSAAAAVAGGDATRSATALEALDLRDHEYAVQDGYKGPTVKGTVANTGEESVDLAEVRVRAYDGDGALLGRYLASTGDLPAGGTWRFEVVLLASADAVADYDVAVVGVPS